MNTVIDDEKASVDFVLFVVQLLNCNILITCTPCQVKNFCIFLRIMEFLP